MLTLRALRLSPIIFALLAFEAGCSKHEQPRQYPFRGDVVRLDPNTNLASIHNEKVEGWMSEMTMDYPIESRSEYLSLRKGEKITATVNVTSEGYWLTNVKEMKEK
jgi:Cu/Ag efflux protein CusF